MSFAGMDTGAVDAVAGRLDDQANRLQHVLGDIDRIMRSAMQHWHGHEAQDFHHWWTQQHRPRLAAAAASLHGAANGVRRNVADQLHASRGGSHGAPGARDLLALADGAYGTAQVIKKDGHTYNKVSDEELRRLGVRPESMVDHRTGFAATLYRAEDGSYILAFAGTDPNDKDGDIATDVLGAKFATAQSQRAIEIARALDSKLGDQLSFTGHSLGGRLAAVASIATGNEATTFNAAGVSDAEFAMALKAAGRDPHLEALVAKTVVMSSPVGFQVGIYSDGPDIYAAERRELEGRITAYHGSHDPLTNVQNHTGAPNAVGHQVTVDSGDKRLLDAHNVGGLESGLPR